GRVGDNATARRLDHFNRTGFQENPVPVNGHRDPREDTPKETNKKHGPDGTQGKGGAGSNDDKKLVEVVGSVEALQRLLAEHWRPLWQSGGGSSSRQVIPDEILAVEQAGGGGGDGAIGSCAEKMSYGGDLRGW